MLSVIKKIVFLRI